MSSKRITHDKNFCLSVLDKAEHVILAFNAESPDQPPYMVPINFARCGDILYVHCAADGGRKLELMRQHGVVSFQAVADVKVVPEKSSTCYASVCGHGNIRMVADQAEKRLALAAITEKFLAACPNPLPDTAVARTAVLRIEMLELVGKHNPGK